MRMKNSLISIYNGIYISILILFLGCFNSPNPYQSNLDTSNNNNNAFSKIKKVY